MCQNIVTLNLQDKNVYIQLSYRQTDHLHFMRISANYRVKMTRYSVVPTVQYLGQN